MGNIYKLYYFYPTCNEREKINGERWTVKQMESQKKKLEEQLKSLTDESRKDDLITFEKLGVDSIMVDEAAHKEESKVREDKAR